jgi:PPM family protein phosphatase
MAIEFGASTDTGRIRENNEDSYCVAPELGLFVLCDGMGGTASGEVASKLAAGTIVEHCREAEANPGVAFYGERIEGASDAANRLAGAVRLANRAVNQAAREDASRKGMGSTVVAVRIVDNRLIVAHVGDSRAYRLRAGELEQLTQDHSFVAEQVRRGMLTAAEAEASKLQNVLLRALGVDDEVEVEINEEFFCADDTLLLCSDGLTRELSDTQIAAVLAEGRNNESGARQLVELANQAGGGDNITAIVIGRATAPAGVLAPIGGWFKGIQRYLRRRMANAEAGAEVPEFDPAGSGGGAEGSEHRALAGQRRGD